MGSQFNWMSGIDEIGRHRQVDVEEYDEDSVEACQEHHQEILDLKAKYRLEMQQSRDANDMRSQPSAIIHQIG